MRPSKSFVVRVFVYSIALLYIAGDLFWFNGPLNRRIQAGRPDSAQSVARAKAHGVAARVFGHSIYLSQVERAARERLWREGRRMEDLDPGQRRIIRLAALNDLIDHELLRVKVQHHGDTLPVSDEEIDAAVAQLALVHGGEEAMRAELAGEGIDSEKELRYRLAARLQQRKYLESRIAEGIEVSEDEAREWFEENLEALGFPRRVKVRQVFLSTLHREPAEARETLAAALVDLKAGRKDFAGLAKELSEDARTRTSGGELGWVTEERLPADFGEAVFALKTGEPALVRTKIGWHLVEVSEAKPAEPRSFEEAREEVFAALENARREEMVKRFREALRAQEKLGVHVYPEMITE